MKLISIVILCGLLFSGCVSLPEPETVVLPELDNISKIVMRTNYPREQLVEISDHLVIQRVLDFINQRNEGWSVPWSGPPIGQVYFHFYDNGEYKGNFYVGPNFFGRNVGNFWSKQAEKEEIDELGILLGLPMLELIERKEGTT